MRPTRACFLGFRPSSTKFASTCHVRSVLRSVGIGSGGTHVVSGSTYKAMSFWLPLLAAAVCAYLGERIVGYYRKRASPEAGTPDGEAA